MLNKESLWKMKNEGLMELCDKYDLGYDPDNFPRKAVIEAIISREASEGVIREACGSDDSDGDIKPLKEVAKRKYVDIVFHEQADEPKVVFLGLNGRFLWLPREIVCRIPLEFMNVIKQAAEVRLVPIEGKDGKLRYKEVKVPTLNYEIVGMGEC